MVSAFFASLRASSSNGQPYYTSLERDGTVWTPFASPSMPNGAVYFAYDKDHQVLFSANTSAGLWRVRTLSGPLSNRSDAGSTDISGGSSGNLDGG